MKKILLIAFSTHQFAGEDAEADKTHSRGRVADALDGFLVQLGFADNATPPHVRAVQLELRFDQDKKLGVGFWHSPPSQTRLS